MIEEVISTHMMKGIKMHNKLMDAFGFLNLSGYQKCQEYHVMEELHNYHNWHKFYLEHHNKLIMNDAFEEIEVIPANWYKYKRQDVDSNTKRSAVKDLMKIWINWEKETKKLLEEKYKEAYEMNDIPVVLKIAECIKDVSGELVQAESKQIALDAINYDMIFITEEQQEMYDKYVEKLANLYKEG